VFDDSATSGPINRSPDADSRWAASSANLGRTRPGAIRNGLTATQANNRHTEALPHNEPSLHQLERAYEIARSGTCQSKSDIVAHLIKEGYSAEQLYGPSLLRALRNLCRSSYRPSDVAA
jgi:hypothetical protein